MLDTNKMRRELDAAVGRFVKSVLAAAAKYVAQAKTQQAARKPAPVPRPAATSRSAAPKPKGKTTPIFRAPLVPVTSQQLAPQPVARKPKGPTPEMVAERLLKLINPSATGYTAEQLSSTLRVANDMMQPVLQKLVDEQKVRIVDEGGAQIYRRPRIEPIRRRRDDTQA